MGRVRPQFRKMVFTLINFNPHNVLCKNKKKKISNIFIFRNSNFRNHAVSDRSFSLCICQFINATDGGNFREMQPPFEPSRNRSGTVTEAG